MSIRVAFVARALRLGGTEKGLVLHARALDRTRFAPEVVTTDEPGPRAAEIEAAGIPITSAGGSDQRLAELLAGADVVHLFRGGEEEALVGPAATGAFVDTDVFGLVAGTAPARPPDCHLLISRSCAARYRREAGLDAAAFHERHRVLGLPVDTTALTQAAPDRRTAKQRLGLDPDRPVVGRIGRADDLKWRRMLCDMVPELLRLAPDAQVLFVGPTPNVRKRLAKLGVLDRCTLVDPELDVAALHAACDVGVSAAELGESQGVAIAETLALGVPVVTCATPWVDNAQLELVEHGRTGYVANHPRPFAEAVAALVTDDGLRERMGAAGRDHVRKHLDVVPLTRRLETLYESLVATGAPPAAWEPSATDIDAYEAEEQRRSAIEFRPLTAAERREAQRERRRERVVRVRGFLQPDRWSLAWSLLRARMQRGSGGAAPERGAARMARIFASLLSAELLSRALAAVATLVVVRAMAPAAFGEIAYAIATAAVVGVLVDLGLPTLLVRDVSADPARAPALLGTVIRLQTVLSLAVYGGGALLALAGVFGGPSEPEVVALGFALMAAGTVIRSLEAALAGYGRAHLIPAVHAVRGVVLVVFTAAAMTIDATPAAALLAALAAEVIGAAVLWLVTAIRAAGPALRSREVDVRSLVRRAVPFALFAGFTLLYTRIDTILLGALGTDHDVGTYGVAVRLLELMLAVPWFFGGAFLATVAQSGAEREDMPRRTDRALRLLLVVCVPLSFAAAVIAGPLVPALAGDDYADSGELLARLSPVLALTAAYIVLINLQVALDRTAVVVRIMAAGVVLKIALGAWAIPEWGAAGAAGTVVAVEASVLVAHWYAARGRFDQPGLLRWSGRLVVATLAMLAVGGPLAVEVSWAAGLVAGLAAFAGVAYAVRCTTPAELRTAWTAIRAPA